MALGILSMIEHKSVVLKEFINGLRKSFSGNDYLRDIHQCEKCGQPSFSKWCMVCEVEQRYNDSK